MTCPNLCLPPPSHTHKDFGYPQETGTEMLKSYVCHQPASVITDSSVAGGVSRRTLPSAAANKPIAISLDSMVGEWEMSCNHAHYSVECPCNVIL